MYLKKKETSIRIHISGNVSINCRTSIELVYKPLEIEIKVKKTTLMQTHTIRSKNPEPHTVNPLKLKYSFEITTTTTIEKKNPAHKRRKCVRTRMYNCKFTRLDTQKTHEEPY